VDNSRLPVNKKLAALYWIQEEAKERKICRKHKVVTAHFVKYGKLWKKFIHAAQYLQMMMVVLEKKSSETTCCYYLFVC